METLGIVLDVLQIVCSVILIVLVKKKDNK